MKPLELANLQHALGLDHYGRGLMYRNSFVTDPGCEDHQACMALVDQGLMSVTRGGPIFGGMDVFRVTDLGKLVVVAESPKPPRLTRAQKRYRKYLAMDFGGSFRQFLASPYAKVRP